jgi:hypothetical protein
MTADPRLFVLIVLVAVVAAGVITDLIWRLLKW